MGIDPLSWWCEFSRELVTASATVEAAGRRFCGGSVKEAGNEACGPTDRNRIVGGGPSRASGQTAKLG
jgi:hypothetical protein